MMMLRLSQRNEVVRVLLRQSLRVRERLNGCMVVMLVNLTIICLSGDLVSVRFDSLGGDSRSNMLLHISEMASARSVPGDSSLSSLHFCSEKREGSV